MVHAGSLIVVVHAETLLVVAHAKALLVVVHAETLLFMIGVMDQRRLPSRRHSVWHCILP